MLGFLADTVLVVHLAFIVFVIFGATVLWRWKRVAFFHIPSLLWALVIEFLPGCLCPLTPLEQLLRRQGNKAHYEGGFIDHYIAPIIYPDVTVELHYWAGVLLLLLNAVLYGLFFCVSGNDSGQRDKRDCLERKKGK